MKKYLDYTGLQRLIKWVKDTFVQNQPGKTLSDVNFTQADKQKLDGLSQSGEANAITQIKRNGLVLDIQDKAVDIAVPVKVSDLTNDSEFQTRSEVQSLISQAGSFKKEVVAQLPSSGKENVIYLKGPKQGTDGNIYEEYLWIAGKWELIGNTATNVDLSDYVRSAELVAITDQEIEQIVQGG